MFDCLARAFIESPVYKFPYSIKVLYHMNLKHRMTHPPKDLQTGKIVMKAEQSKDEQLQLIQK